MRHPIRLVLLLAVLSPMPTGCRKDSAEPEKPKGPEESSVVVVKVESRKLASRIRLPGELWAYRNVALFAKVPGFVEKIEVDRGSKVKADQLLAKLTAPELEAQRNEAVAKLASDEATLAKLKEAARTP